MNQLATPPYLGKRKSIVLEFLDSTEQKIHVNALTQTDWEVRSKNNWELDQMLDAITKRICNMEKNPYFSEDEVPALVFENARKMVARFSEFLPFVNPDDIGTTPNGTVTIRFSKTDKVYLNLEIGKSTLAYVVSDQNELFIADEGKLDYSTIHQIAGKLNTYIH
jgi:hypothetical protein